MPHISNTYKKKKLQKKNGLDKYTDCKIKINLKYKIWFLNNNPTGFFLIPWQYLLKEQKVWSEYFQQDFRTVPYNCKTKVIYCFRHCFLSVIQDVYA